MLNTFQKIPILKRLNDDMLKTHIVKKNITQKSYSKGATIYNQNDCCNTLDVILEGSLIAYSLSENGSATTMFEFGEGSILGANLLFGDSNVYPLNIYCQQNCNIIHVNKEAVSNFLHDYNFVIGFVKSLSKNSQGMNKKITMFAQKTLRENILDYLKQQCHFQQSKAIILPMSKKQLADYFGVQRQSLFRELKRLEDSNIIEIKNRQIKILII